VGLPHIREYCELDDTRKALMRSAMNQPGMSARAFHRVLKPARTITDLAGTEQMQAAHPSASPRAGLVEVIQYSGQRPLQNILRLVTPFEATIS
jgi:hypothetical protein